MIRGAKVKIDKPDKFEGNATELSNWLFTVKQFCAVSGVSDSTE